jgi:hypothetical protein
VPSMRSHAGRTHAHDRTHRRDVRSERALALAATHRARARSRAGPAVHRGEPTCGTHRSSGECDEESGAGVAGTSEQHKAREPFSRVEACAQVD